MGGRARERNSLFEAKDPAVLIIGSHGGIGELGIAAHLKALGISALVPIEKKENRR